MSGKQYHSLLFDRIRSKPVSVNLDPPSEFPPSDTVPFECSSVIDLARSHFQVNDEGLLRCELATIPSGAPPYRTVWYEYFNSTTGNHRGTFVRTYDVTIDTWLETPQFREFLRGARWVQVFTSFFESKDNYLVSGNTSTVFALDKHGRGLGYFVVHAGKVVEKEELLSERGRDKFGAWVAKDMVALFFQSLLACKNVETEDVNPPERLSRKHERRTGLPYVRYHTLKVFLPGTRHRIDFDEIRRINRNTTSLGLHLVRGHFKVYTEEHKLFGRIVGSFYWPPHIRGSLAAGSIGKHYEESLAAGGVEKRYEESPS